MTDVQEEKMDAVAIHRLSIPNPRCRPYPAKNVGLEFGPKAAKRIVIATTDIWKAGMHTSPLVAVRGADRPESRSPEPHCDASCELTEPGLDQLEAAGCDQ